MRALGPRYNNRLEPRGPRNIGLPYSYAVNDVLFTWYRKSQAKVFKFKVFRNGKLALTNGLNETIIHLRLF